jgi:hypothetical protein
MEKISIRKILIILFGHLWVVEETHIKIFAFKFNFRCQQPDIVPIICLWSQQDQRQTGVVDTGGKSTTQGELVANLLPVSLIPTAICHRCH